MIAHVETHPGLVRQNNEDAVALREIQHDDEKGFLAVVADGMGGHACGEVASSLAIETLVAEPLPHHAAELQARIRSAHAAIKKAIREKPECASMGTTIVAGIFWPTNYTIAWVGDSRAYLYRNATLRKISTDHSLVEELIQSGAITAEQAVTHPQKNVITRALGVADEPVVDVLGGDALSGDIFLIASDGLTDLVSDADLAEHLKNKATASPDEISGALIQWANERGGRDNTSVAILKYGAESGSKTLKI